MAETATGGQTSSGATNDEVRSNNDSQPELQTGVQESTNETSDEIQLSKTLVNEIDSIKLQKSALEDELTALKSKLNSMKDELEREAQKRCDLEQRFTEEAKRSGDQIAELIAKSNQDDDKLKELRKRLGLYREESSAMVQNFTASREVLNSHIQDLKEQNNYLLGRFVAKSSIMANTDIDLPQTVEELQFLCLTLQENLIVTAMAKERFYRLLQLSPEERLDDIDFQLENSMHLNDDLPSQSRLEPGFQIAATLSQQQKQTPPDSKSNVLE